MAWGSQVYLRPAAVNVRAIASHPVYISLTEADPYPTTLSWHRFVAHDLPISWMMDRKEEIEKTLICCSLKCFTPKQEAAEQTDIQAGGRMFSLWEVQRLLSLLTDPVSETLTSLFSPEQCNCLSVPKECSQPVVPLLYPTQHRLLLPVHCFLNSQGTIFFCRMKES